MTFDRESPSLLVVGDNGDGKSSILRSLAMGVCDQSSASALFRELPGEFVRHGSKKGTGTIIVELRGAGRYRYRIETRIRSLASFERVDQTLYRFDGRKRKKLSQDEFPWGRIFVSGYGAGLRTDGTADVDYYLAADAVYPLFKYDAPLQNPELVIRRIVDEARANGGRRAADAALKGIKGLLKDVLQLDPDDEIKLTRTGIGVSSRWGSVELSSLGDGYRSTVTWILDLLSWWFVKLAQEKKKYAKSTDVTGIVFVDEIEQHLHPKWQRSIVGLLTNAFPHLQLIATTHSPLVVSGCESVSSIMLGEDRPQKRLPFGWLAEDVYALMGVPTSRSSTFVREVLDEFVGLDRRRLQEGLTPKAARRLSVLRNKLESDLPADDPIRLTSELENLGAVLRAAAKARKESK